MTQLQRNVNEDIAPQAHLKASQAGLTFALSCGVSQTRRAGEQSLAETLLRPIWKMGRHA